MKLSGNRTVRRFGIAALALTLVTGVAIAGYQIVLNTAIDLSVAPTTGSDGDNAFKGKLIYLQYETAPSSGTYQDVLISVYADSPNPSNMVWDYDGKMRPARDIFVTRSLDNGATWSQPENITNFTNVFSATADPDGVGPLGQTTYWGDCDKPTLMGTTQTGKNALIFFGAKYDQSSSGNQKKVAYAEFGGVEVPYECAYVAWTKDAGATWSLQQLSDGTRDVKQTNAHQTGAGFAMVWQEDPHGLQPGQAEGPGDGGSGAKTSQGTDIWYTAATRTAMNGTGFTGFPAGVRVTDNFTSRDQDNLEYGPERASRANVAIIGQSAVIAYEETKALEQFDTGKYIRYHVITPFSQVTTSETGFESHAYGLTSDVTKGQGWIISDPAENARRVRIVNQGTPGPNTGLLFAFVYRQGLYDQGGPADVMVRCGRKDSLDGNSTGLRPEDLHPGINFSSTATYPLPTGLATGSDRELAAGNAKPQNMSSSQGLAADSDDDNIENALAHRGEIDGDEFIVGYSWTRDGTLARYTDLENFNFYIRRSNDGGQTWTQPRNMTNLTDTKISVREPRIVKTPKNINPATPQDTDVIFIAWGTELNQYEHLKERTINESIYITRTTDNGLSWEPTQLLADAVGDEEDQESQLRPEPEGKVVHAVWMNMDSGTGATNVMYSKGTEAFFQDSKGGGDDDSNCSTGSGNGVSLMMLAGLLALAAVGIRSFRVARRQG
ncbi:MAG: exo-alpha-sialidase [Planctomycetes bacterium]|nr:exo-alpha-sialidase [Planctomycetota bacterium]